MKKFAGFIFSAPLMAVLLAIFAISIAAATFIENDFGSQAARAIVYNARWFEVLLLLGCINLTGRIIHKSLYQRKKLTIFLFHIAFVIILAGAAITRYSGWEGTMSIREGAEESRILSDRTFISVNADESYQFKISYSPFFNKRFSKEIELDKQPVKIKLEEYIPNAYETIEPVHGGNAVAEFIYSDPSGRKNVVIENGETKNAGEIALTFNDSPDTSHVHIFTRNDTLFFNAPFPVTVTSMDGSAYRLMERGIAHPFKLMQLYSFRNQNIVLSAFYTQGRIIARQLPPGSGSTYDAVVLSISGTGFSKQTVLLGKAGYQGIPEHVNINGRTIILSYGSLYRTLPFKLKLKDFIIERYPGSHSPSSFESVVQLSDSSRNVDRNYRIYMNNILKYRGYRFYQSSYDADEKGTLLSVNHDLAGTSLTYCGYALLGIGMILSLFNRNSRFRSLSLESRKLAKVKNSMLAMFFLILVASSGILAQSGSSSRIIPPDPVHASSFGSMLVQDNSGRIEPLNTLSSEVIRKLLRDDKYKGMNSDQVFLGMLTDPSSWQFEPIIRSTNSQVLNLLGTREKYHSFASFFRDQSYVLQNPVDEAYRKKPAERSRFDNEIMKLDEKVNICYLVFTGELLKVFPVPGDSTQTWYNQSTIINKVKNADSIFANHAFPLYQQEVATAMMNGNWQPAEQVLEALASYQKKYAAGIIPSETKVNAEILLNKSDVFSRVSRYYGFIGFILLVLHFVMLFQRRLKLKFLIWTGTIMILILFCVHTAGLGFRWYVSGHAPWSNGYEALIYVAWASVLSGIIFSFKSSLTMAVGSILAFLTLFVAHLSWMDPQITNLVPVLKSYWLVIHVATITASYGFLAMGAILAFVNLLMVSLHTPSNRYYIKYTILEVSNTIEMALTIGLYLLTAGVFLGAIWANESWGRYWGWDPKETWALVTVVVYAFILHMRMVPSLKGTFAFNLGSLLAFSSVIMTYFGVNYYLSGLHSYAKGDPLPVPSFVYYTLVIIIITAVIARIRSAKWLTDDNTQ